MGTQQQVPGEGVNQVKAKNYVNKYEIVVETEKTSGDSSTNNKSEAFRGPK